MDNHSDSLRKQSIIALDTATAYPQQSELQEPRYTFSRTVLVPDQAVRHWFFSYPEIIRGETMIYGSALDGSIAYDLRMKRRRDCRTEDELIAKLQQERGVQTPAALREAASQ